MDHSIQLWIVIEAIKASWKELLFAAGLLVYLTAGFIRELRTSHINGRTFDEDYYRRRNAKTRRQASRLS
jgi:hypothetical protein